MGVILRALGAIILYYITKAVYSLYFHPLAKYPGPPWAAFSRIPYLVPLNSGKLPFAVKEMHDKYGPIVRLSANELSLNDARAWRDIYNNKDMLRPPQWGGRPPGVEAFNLISASAADHARFRKGLSPAFSDKATREYEPLIRKYTNKLLTRFDAAISKGNDAAVIDLVQWVNFATFDIIGELTVGSDYKCLENGTGHAAMDVLTHFQAVVIGASIKYYPWLDAFLASITPKSALQALENVFQDGRQRLQARSKLKRPSHPDLIAHIESYNEQASPSNMLSEDEIEQNVLAIIVGGSETLTTSISGTFHHLLAASNQDQLNRLVKEIRSSFSSQENINGTALSQLPYLNAVIDETLRLCPPIPDMLRRDVPSSGATIAGHVLPPGTTVSVSCYSMFKSAEHFENPDAFEPERFLQGKTYPAFHPFGVGSHNCLGQPLARLEMRLLLALVLYRYDVKVPKGEMLKKWLDQKIYWTWEKHPLNVELTLSK